MVSASKLFTILGGKWTTYRRMGEDLVNRIEKELGWMPKQSVTKTLLIHGYATGMNWDDPLYFYGADAVALQQKMNDAGKWISEKLHIHEAQVAWAVQEEMARTVEDVLSRRTRALLLDAGESMRMARPVAELMAKQMQKDAQWVEDQVATFSQLAASYKLRD